MPTAKANGKTFNFPDGTTPEQMGVAIDEYFQPDAQLQPVAQPEQKQGLFNAPIDAPTAQTGLAGGIDNLPFGMGIAARRVGDLFTGNSRDTETSNQLKEIGNAPELNQFSKPAAKTSAGLLASFDPEENKRVIQGNFPEAKFTQDEKGNEIVQLESGSYLINKPGFSAQDFVKLITQGAAFGKAGQVTNRIKGAKGVAAVGAAEAGVSAGLDFTSGALSAGEDESAIQKGVQEVDPVEAGLAGTIGGVSSLGGKGLTRFRNRKAADDISTVNPDEVAGIKEASDALGVDVFTPQLSNSGSDLAAMQLLSTLPASSQVIAQGLKKQNKQVYDAVNKILGDIAPNDALETASQATRDAAQGAIKGAKDQRREITKPLFDGALNSSQKIDTSEVLKNINKELDGLAGGTKVSKKLKTALKLLQTDSGANKLAPKALDSVYKDLGDQINTLARSGKDPHLQSKLIDVRKQIGDLLEEGGTGFKDANAAFRQASEELVNPLEKGQIGRIAKVKDENLRSVSKTIFTQAESNPAIMRKTRKIIEGQSPEAWAGIVRVHLEDGLSQLKDLTPTGNLPQQIKTKLFGTPKQMKMLNDAVPKEQRKNLNYLRMVLDATSKGRASNSTTAAQQAAKERLDDRAGGWLLEIVGQPLKSKDRAIRVVQDNLQDNNARKLAELLTDPKWETQMKRLRQIPPSDPTVLQTILITMEKMDGEVL